MPEKYTSSESWPPRIEVGKASHKGMVRDHNEDCLVSLELLFGEDATGRFFGLYAVADGVGGYEGGEVASRLALLVFAENVVRALLLPGPNSETHRLNQEVALQILTEGVKTANNQVYTQAEQSGIGTTLAAVLIIDTMAYIANIGDSRVYSLNQRQLRQITNDHSL